MSQLCHNRFEESPVGKVCMAMVMLLCLRIMVHMLGVPVALLNSGGTDDTLAVSAYEGLSIPSTLSQLTPSVEMVHVIDAQPSVHVPVLVYTLFHPPVH